MPKLTKQEHTAVDGKLVSFRDLDGAVFDPLSCREPEKYYTW